jgi:hypothetical protein
MRELFHDGRQQLLHELLQTHTGRSQATHVQLCNDAAACGVFCTSIVLKAVLKTVLKAVSAVCRIQLWSERSAQRQVSCPLAAQVAQSGKCTLCTCPLKQIMQVFGRKSSIQGQFPTPVHTFARTCTSGCTWHILLVSWGSTSSHLWVGMLRIRLVITPVTCRSTGR